MPTSKEIFVMNFKVNMMPFFFTAISNKRSFFRQSEFEYEEKKKVLVADLFSRATFFTVFKL